jgi:glycosyltransferase involved in cell wall biosynthesis
MEALACGIPVLASAVSGVPEIVTGGSGVLFPASADAAEIGALIAAAARDAQAWRTRRAAARKAWAEHCNARVNHARFVGDLLNIANSISVVPDAIAPSLPGAKGDA